MQYVDIETNNGPVEMSVEEFARWMCFAEALILIQNKAVELGVAARELLMNASPIEEYIHGCQGVKKFEGRYHSMLHDVKCEIALGRL